MGNAPAKAAKPAPATCTNYTSKDGKSWKPLHTFKASQKQVDFYDGMDVSEPKANYYSKYSCKN